jgi:hypothetical protein
MANTHPRAGVDHRHNSHRNILMPAERAQRIKRAADSLGVSSETLIQRFIDIGLIVFTDVK